MSNGARQSAYSRREDCVTDKQSTFLEVHDEFRLKILRYLTRMVGENEAEDLTQEVFVRVSHALPAFREESSLSTWIYKIATNVALDKLRTKSFRQSTRADLLTNLITLDKIHANSPDAENRRLVEQQAIREEMNACIRNVIDKLPENYRTVIALSMLEGFQDKEVAEITGLSLQATKIRLHRARKRLKEELSKHCVFYHNEQNELACDLKE
jgi:RNA polymerase sigma-70 factor, ECF subfamily